MHQSIIDIWPNLIVPGEYIQEVVAGLDSQESIANASGDELPRESNVQQVGLSEE